MRDVIHPESDLRSLVLMIEPTLSTATEPRHMWKALPFYSTRSLGLLAQRPLLKNPKKWGAHRQLKIGHTTIGGDARLVVLVYVSKQLDFSQPSIVVLTGIFSLCFVPFISGMDQGAWQTCGASETLLTLYPSSGQKT